MADPNLFYLPVARALAQTRVVRERLLPRPGDALVKQGDRVEPMDVVARTYVPLAPFVVNIGQLFKVPSRHAHTLMLKKVGDSFAKDEVLARKKSLIGKSLVCRAPSAGRLLAEHNGEVLLELAPSPLDLPANVRGTVANTSRFGVVLQATGALVQGAWGNGRESYGVLKLLSDTREQTLSADLIDVGMLGTIIVVGGAIEPEALRQAEAQQVRGIIAGSMPSSLREQAHDLSFPVMLTEGFGGTAMAAAAFDVFKLYNGREASLRAVLKTRWGALRPELVVPLTPREGSTGELVPQHAVLQKEMKVRVCAGEQRGAMGRMLSEQPQTRAFANGVRARAVEVETSDGDRLWVAINNLEAIA